MHQGESLIKDGGSQILPEYTRFDAAVYYMISDDLSLRLHMENLTDELYFPHSHSTHQFQLVENETLDFPCKGTFKGKF